MQLLLGPAQLLAGHLRGAAVRAAPRPRRAPGAARAGVGRGMPRVPGARGRPRARGDRRGCRDRSGRRRGGARAGARAGCAAGLPAPPSSDPRAGAPANRAPPPGLAFAPPQCGQSSVERTIVSSYFLPPSPAAAILAGQAARPGRACLTPVPTLGRRPVVTEREYRNPSETRIIQRETELGSGRVPASFWGRRFKRSFAPAAARRGRPRRSLGAVDAKQPAAHRHPE